mgnify:CR=1 FL=1
MDYTEKYLKYKKKYLDLKDQIAGMPRGGEERRIDASDGKAYTQAEFIDYYGNTVEWKRSVPAPLEQSEGITLTNADLPEGATEVENIQVERSVVVAVDITDVTRVRDRAFFAMRNLKTVFMPQVTHIGKFAFSDCYSLESIDMPLVTYIDNNAFGVCISLKMVNMPLVTTLRNNVFVGCHKDL